MGMEIKINSDINDIFLFINVIKRIIMPLITHRKPENLWVFDQLVWLLRVHGSLIPIV